jgi:predicted RNA-binding Zn-ribbon protein involved in translation (DUF1610 family)
MRDNKDQWQCPKCGKHEYRIIDLHFGRSESNVAKCLGCDYISSIGPPKISWEEGGGSCVKND